MSNITIYGLTDEHIHQLINEQEQELEALESAAHAVIELLQPLLCTESADTASTAIKTLQTALNPHKESMN